MCVLQPGSEKSRVVELEKGLAGSLSKTLEVVEDGSTLLDYYKGTITKNTKHETHRRRGKGRLVRHADVSGTGWALA
jgi:hypothetical protein